MATHSITLAWQIPWTEEPGGLPSVGSQKLDRTKHTKKAHKVHKGRKKSITLPETNGFVSEIHIEMHWLGWEPTSLPGVAVATLWSRRFILASIISFLTPSDWGHSTLVMNCLKVKVLAAQQWPTLQPMDHRQVPSIASLSTPSAVPLKILVFTNSLAVQWLGLHTVTVEGMGLWSHKLRGAAPPPPHTKKKILIFDGRLLRSERE